MPKNSENNTNTQTHINLHTTHTHKYDSKSSMIERVYLSVNGDMLEFELEIDWHEKYKFLKVENTFDIRNENATYEIQFGHCQRTTTLNTSHDIG